MLTRLINSFRKGYDDETYDDYYDEQEDDGHFDNFEHDSVENGSNFSSNEPQEEYEKVAILDAGSQYGKLIDKKLRALEIKADMLPLDTNPIDLSNYLAIIISGGPNSLNTVGSINVHPHLFTMNIPILGICYGMHIIANYFGGTVVSTDTREDGVTNVKLLTNNALFRGLPSNQQVLLTHGDTVTVMPPNFKIIGESGHSITAIEHKTEHIYAVQFHPEVDLTCYGEHMLKNFLFNIADMKGDYKLENRLKDDVNTVIEDVGDKDVVCMVSGGVDSCTLYLMLSNIIPSNRLHAIYIDTGFMRLGETEAVKKALCEFNLKIVDAQDRFRDATTVISGVTTQPLSTVIDPEIKRKIIGDTFIRVTEEEIKKLNLPDDFILAQGSLRPDLIESGSHIASKNADTIKTHHNDTQLVRERREKGLVIEPLKDYHKDEVREIAKELGLQRDIVERQPFPGPGLAIRILCADEEYRTDDYSLIVCTLEKICSTEEFKGIYPILLPIRSVGVQGDARSYSYVCGLYNFDKRWCNWDKLYTLSQNITNGIRKINRVIYMFNVPESLKVTKTRLNEDSISTLRTADYIVRECLAMYNTTISQIPVILLPLSFNNNGKYSVVIRTMITNDFMTGVPAIPTRNISSKILDTCVEALLAKENVSMVGYDLTGKPPGTTEWE
jgi:GMP synthase (glutamine-hydrolysing)